MRLADRPAFAYLATLVLAVVIVSPVLAKTPKDSFPLSTFPMFAEGRKDSNVTVDHAVAIDAEGRETPITPHGFVRPVAPPERLAAIRVLVGLFGAVYCTVRAPSMSSVAGLHATSFSPIGVVRVLRAPLPSAVVWVLVVAAVILAWAPVVRERPPASR